MENEAALIQQDIEATKMAMAEKLATLEQRTRRTVNKAKTTLQHTMDLKHQVEQHPWPMMGAAVLAGYMLSQFFSPGSSHRKEERILIIEASTGRMRRPSSRKGQGVPSVSDHNVYMREREERTDTTEDFANDFSDIKRAAIGAVAGIVQDLLKRAVSPVPSSSEAPSTTSSREPSPQSSVAPQ